MSVFRVECAAEATKTENSICRPTVQPQTWFRTIISNYSSRLHYTVIRNSNSNYRSNSSSRRLLFYSISSGGVTLSQTMRMQQNDDNKNYLFLCSLVFYRYMERCQGQFTRRLLNKWWRVTSTLGRQLRK